MKNKNHRQVLPILPPKNKKGFIRLVEAFIAIILIIGVLSIVIDKKSVEKDVSSEVYNKENLILKKIQLNDTLRASVLNAIVPVSWDDDLNFPPDIKNEINKIPADVKCFDQICDLDDVCIPSELGEENEVDIYARSIVIAAENNIVNPTPKQLKLFCWKV